MQRQVWCCTSQMHTQHPNPPQALTWTTGQTSKRGTAMSQKEFWALTRFLAETVFAAGRQAAISTLETHFEFKFKPTTQEDGSQSCCSQLHAPFGWESRHNLARHVCKQEATAQHAHHSRDPQLQHHRGETQSGGHKPHNLRPLTGRRCQVDGC